jgi:hypothetical protein
VAPRPVAPLNAPAHSLRPRIHPTIDHPTVATHARLGTQSDTNHQSGRPDTDSTTDSDLPGTLRRPT